MGGGLMAAIVYEEISSLEAMALIDKCDVSNLYFVEIYFESEYPYGSNGKVIHYMTPDEKKQTEPIKYGEEIIVATNNFLRPYKKIVAKPGEIINETSYRRYSSHRWVVKKQAFNLKKKPPIEKD